ncbi:hypothetical protein [Deinococcus sp. QL22]|uniref:hypothetical protein n=1 Tax=Deinococcus sp. QL22 TaxID=2939437 RepID=UPI002017B198|nr:hypothetical protein [Deinococcus sp. QL22]UQN09094.1 hypothetical protein M1R55_23900 [Deinococcus sp. QL22]
MVDFKSRRGAQRQLGELLPRGHIWPHSVVLGRPRGPQAATEDSQAVEVPVRVHLVGLPSSPQAKGKNIAPGQARGLARGLLAQTRPTPQGIGPELTRQQGVDCAQCFPLKRAANTARQPEGGLLTSAAVRVAFPAGAAAFSANCESLHALARITHA